MSLSERMEAAEPFFRLAREVINPVDGERPWHADSKDWMVVFSFAGHSLTLGDLRRAAGQDGSAERDGGDGVPVRSLSVQETDKPLQAEGAPAAEGKEEARSLSKELVASILPNNASLTNFTDFRCSHADLEQVVEAAYKRGWNDREGDLITGVDRVYGSPPAPAAEPVEWHYEYVNKGAGPGGCDEVTECVSLDKPISDSVRNVRAVPRPQQPVEISREEIAREIDAEAFSKNPWDATEALAMSKRRVAALDKADAKLKENGLSREELGGSARASRGAAGPSDCAENGPLHADGEDLAHELFQQAELVDQFGMEAQDAEVADLLRRAGRALRDNVPPSDGWQDIESTTPPHDTAVLLGWQDSRGGCWISEVAAYSTGERFDNGYSNLSLHGSATHWMPLPSPPQNSDGEDA